MRLSWAPFSVSAPYTQTVSCCLHVYSLSRHATLHWYRRCHRCHPTLCPSLGCACSVSDSVVALLWLPESEFLTRVFVPLHHHGSATFICVCTGPPSYLFLTSLRPKLISTLIIKVRCCIYFLVRWLTQRGRNKGFKRHLHSHQYGTRQCMYGSPLQLVFR